MHPASVHAWEGRSPRRTANELVQMPTVPAPSSRPSTASSRPATGYSVISPWPGSAWQGNASMFSVTRTSLQTDHKPAGPYTGIQTSPGLSPMTRTSRNEQMPTPLPVPSPAITGWTPPTPPRPQYSRTQSYVGRYRPQLPEPARPLTAPSLSLPLRSPRRDSPARPSRNLPPLASITERREETSSWPSSSGLTLPAIQDPTRSPTAASGPSRTSSASQTGPDYATVRSGSQSTWHASSMSSAASSDTPALSAYTDRPRAADQVVTGRPSTSSEGSNLFPQAPPPLRREQTYYASSESSFGYPRTPEQPRLNLPAAPANYSRVLVGSLCSICQHLQDEDGQQGLFFFAHDLGVRTEGTFTLRFTLVNLTS